VNGKMGVPEVYPLGTRLNSCPILE